MGAATNWFENQLVDIFFRGQNATINAKTLTWSVAPTMYVALYTVSPDDTSTSNSGTGTECTGGSYARVSIACALTNWAGTQGATATTASTGTGGTTSNLVIITFPTPTAGWGTVVAFALCDVASGAGNMFYWGTLTTSKVINSGDQAPVFNVNALSIQVDN